MNYIIINKLDHFIHFSYCCYCYCKYGYWLSVVLHKYFCWVQNLIWKWSDNIWTVLTGKQSNNRKFFFLSFCFQCFTENGSNSFPHIFAHVFYSFASREHDLIIIIKRIDENVMLAVHANWHAERIPSWTPSNSP